MNDPTPTSNRLFPTLAAAGAVLLLFALVGFGIPNGPAEPGSPAAESPSRPAPGGLAGPPWSYPEARRSDRVDTLHGRRVADPYRWMEDMDSDETRGWAKAQDEMARRVLHDLPGFDALQARLEEVSRFDSLSAPVPRGDRLFYTRRAPGQQRSVLLVRDGLEAEPRTVVDANLLEDRVLAGFVPGPDGQRLAYELNPVGSGWGVWRVRDLATGKDLPDRILGLRYGAPVWSPDGHELYYAAFEVPEKGTELESTLGIPRIYRHRVGTTGPDPVLFERPDQPGWIYGLAVTEDGRRLVITAVEGTASENRVFLLDLKAEDPRAPEAVHPLVPEASASFSFLANRGARLYFLTDLDAPRSRVVAVDLGEDPEWRGPWTEILPQSDQVLSSCNVVADHLIGLYLRDAVPEVRIFELEGEPRHRLRLPQLGTTFSGFVGSRTDPAAYFTVNSVALPSTPYRLDPKSGEIDLVARPESAFDPQDFVLDQVFYRSEDGTRVPMFLAYRKGIDPKSDRPVMMYGYGAYGWPAFPWFQPHVVVWMERGGLYALPGIRGGGEYGEPWHKAGSGRHKQTSIDDFVAAAEFLIEEGYTSRGKLAARGGSASGMLAGAALVQRPDLFSAVLINIPVLDLIRGHKLTSGAYRFAEFGTPDDPKDLEVLLSYSPYHNLEPGRCYPATLVIAGEKDEVAPPVHAYKFTAALQHAQRKAGDGETPCPEPALLKIAWGAGHSIGATAEDWPEAWASQLAFLGWQTGLEMTKDTGAAPEVAEPADVGRR